MTGGRDVPATRGVPTVFLGTGSFAVPVLDAVARSPELRLEAVVTAPPRPAGRGERLRRSPIAERAERLEGVRVLEPARLRAPESIAEVAALEPALLVLADYGQMVPGTLLDLPRHRALNLHPSLLPRHRGATPVPATILAGDRQTGVTLMVMDRGLDTGPIVAQVAVPLEGDETTPELEAALAEEAALLLEGVLPSWLAGTRPARPQPAEGVTLTRPLRREDGRLDPQGRAEELERQVRAYQPWPGTFAETVAGRLIVWRARPLGIVIAGQRAAEGGDGTTGLLVPDADGLALVVADGALRLDEVQLAGKRRMSGAELRRGHPELVGSRLPPPALP